MKTTYRTQHEIYKPFGGVERHEWPIYSVGGKHETLAVCDSAEKANRIVAAMNCHADLLAALEGVVRVADRATVEFDAARAAIAKAKAVQS